MIKKLPRLKEIITGVIDQEDIFKEVMYKSYYGYLMAVVMRYINNRNDAEEIVNDTFIKIFLHISRFQMPYKEEETEKAFKGWIAKIASRNSIDYLRKRKLITVDFDGATDEQHPMIYSMALDQLHVKDILNLLNTLPESQKVIFNMYEIEGFSHEEISEFLSIPENICRVYLGRAKQKLRKLYTKTLIDTDGTN